MSSHPQYAANSFLLLPHLRAPCERFQPKSTGLAEEALFSKLCRAIFKLVRKMGRVVAKNTGDTYRSGAVKGRVQVKNPATGHYVKIDTKTGRIVDQKKSPGPYKGVRDISRNK